LNFIKENENIIASEEHQIDIELGWINGFNSVSLNINRKKRQFISKEE